MTAPRFFLSQPDDMTETQALACATAATKAANCAFIIVPATITAEAVAALQGSGLAVILRDSEARMVHRLKADGLLLSSMDDFAEARVSLKNESLGLLAGVSRHMAMEAAEAGADFMAFTQTKQYAGEPIIGWWQDVTDVPSAAHDPVTPEALATLLPQRPDFIRPGDEMWQSAEMATTVLSALKAGLKS